MTYTRPFRRTILQFSQTRFTLARTFIGGLQILKISKLVKPTSIWPPGQTTQGPKIVALPRNAAFIMPVVRPGCLPVARLAVQVIVVITTRFAGSYGDLAAELCPHQMRGRSCPWRWLSAADYQGKMRHHFPGEPENQTLTMHIGNPACILTNRTAQRDVGFRP